MDSSLARREIKTYVVRTTSHSHAVLKHAKHSGIKGYLLSMPFLSRQFLWFLLIQQKCTSLLWGKGTFLSYSLVNDSFLSWQFEWGQKKLSLQIDPVTHLQRTIFNNCIALNEVLTIAFLTGKITPKAPLGKQNSHLCASFKYTKHSKETSTEFHY